MVGVGWTWALVDDTPHDSLLKAENQELIEAEAPGEVEKLEDKVVHGIEMGMLKVPEGMYARTSSSGVVWCLERGDSATPPPALTQLTPRRTPTPPPPN